MVGNLLGWKPNPYTASEPYTDTGVLAYIVCKGNNTWPDYVKASPAQVAVWLWIQNNDTGFSNITPVDKYTEDACDNYEAGLKLYNEAVKAVNYGKSNCKINYYILNGQTYIESGRLEDGQQLIYITERENPGNPGNPENPENPGNPGNQTNVSLQKFISRVDTSAPSKSEVTQVTDELNYRGKPIRKDTGTKVDNSDDNSDDNSIAKSINYMSEINPSTTVVGKYDSYKNNYPKIVEKGNWVTYTIYVYNNGNKSANVTVKDTLPINYNSDNVKVYKSNGDEIKNPVNNGKTITVNFSNLGANSNTLFYVSVNTSELNSGEIYWNIAKITSPNENKLYRQEDGDSFKIEKEPSNFSLQKYIVNVTDNEGKVTFNDQTSRKNKGAKDYIESQTISAENYYNAKISKYDGHKGNDYTEQNYKTYNPVQIKPGDKVTYRIYIYNNGERESNTLYFKDYFPKEAKFISISEISNPNGAKYTCTSDINSLTVTVGFNEAPVGMIIGFDITLQFNTYSPDIMWNFVGLFFGNSSECKYVYRMKDADCVQMPCVSLQKFITRVDSEIPTSDSVKETTFSSIYERADKGTVGYNGVNPYNRYIQLDKGDGSLRDSGADSTASAKYKNDNPVPIKLNDWVTYRIYVYNNGNSQVNNVKVTDTLPITYNSSYVKIMDSNGKNISHTHNGKTVTVTLNVPANSLKYFFVSVKFSKQANDNKEFNRKNME